MMKGGDNKRAFDYQSKLPSLPLPSLEQTCEKYLQSVRPFVTEDEYAETERHTNLFQNGVGRELHAKLEKIAENSRNWMADMWYGAYLDYRGPLPAISNTAGGISPTQEFDQPEHGSQYKRASVWIYYIVQKLMEVLRQEIPLQKLGKMYPMDMTQYIDFFCSGRIPGEKRDAHVHYINYLTKKDGTLEITCNIKHIVVLMRGRIFKVPMFDEEGKPLLPPSIERQLLKVVGICEEAGYGDAVGSLTAGDRDTWYKAYKHLCMLDKQNKMNVNIINEAIIAFAFDDVETFGLQDSMEHAVLGDCRNRWFDKSHTGITGTTGLICSNVDHIHYDGNVSSQILKDVKDALYAIQFKWKEVYKPQNMEDPIELQFIVDDYILNIIQQTQVKHNLLVSSLHCIDRPIQGYGKGFARLRRVNPDAVVQMAIQLAYYSLHKKCVATYESGTTRMYYHGRTETVRSCTCESKAWVESMYNNNANRPLNRELFWKAVNNHNQLMMDACQGKGIDRHLFALKKIAANEDVPTPSIFTDKSWKLSGGDGGFVISSSLSGFHELHGSMAPMDYDGYGAFYTIDNEWVYVCISTWKDSTKTDCSAYYDSLVNAFHSIKDLLSDQPKL